MRKEPLTSGLPSFEQAGKRRSKNWALFAKNLTLILASLQEDHFLILRAKHGNRFLQFYCEGGWGLRIEVVSNYYLQGDDCLTWEEMAWLETHGWNVPTGTPQEATPDNDPDGSSNHFIDFPASTPRSEITNLAIETLVHGLSFPYPSALMYEAFNGEGDAIEFQALGLKPAPQKNKSVMDEVLSVFREVTHIDDLALDDDGDVTVHFGSITISAAKLPNTVRLFSGLVDDVAETHPLLSKLNKLNHGLEQLRFVCHEGAVYALQDIPSDPFVPNHLATALIEFSEKAAGVALLLQAENAGKAVIDTTKTNQTMQ